MIVNRGPQFVQLMKGYRNRRSRGFINSRKQSSQILTSGEISAFAAARMLLALIRNTVSCCNSASRGAIPVIFASGGIVMEAALGGIGGGEIEELSADGAEFVESDGEAVAGERPVGAVGKHAKRRR